MANHEEEMDDIQPEETKGEEDLLPGSKPVAQMYEDWFLDYASYVIMERAVPKLEDGLKPVQRRILHAMKEMDDGRFNKVANIIGQTMQYHPHGDAAIGDAMVNMGQKDLMIETQGNWGDMRTGDGAAASRYIEARLSKFALEVAFNPDTTEWQMSYDGRKREPVALPMKFPLLLAQGAEGIAVGLATKVMPHNFLELIDASIQVLKGKKTNLLPDFPTGGLADFSEYNGGQRGGRIRVRSRIEIKDKKTLLIKDVPYGVTTSTLIDSIIKANDKGKIKIKQVVDNTAQNVEIVVELSPGTSPDVALDALYAFTDCETSISPNTCVILEDKPQFLDVNYILKLSTERTLGLLKRELEIKKGELEEKWHFSSLEKIFIENRIYRDIEECETWEAVIKAIDKGLKPHKKKLLREVTEEDIVRLTEIRIKRISKFDAFKADEAIKKLEDELAQVKYDLEHLVDFAVDYFKRLKEKFGKGKERKTEIRTFDTIKATAVAATNQKLYVNREEGFVGYGLKKDEYIEDCSDIDDIIVFRRDGKMMVTRIADKTFVGKDILHAAVWKKGDEMMVYNMAYLDGKSGRSFAKRFNVTAITRDKEYDLTKGEKNSKVLYLTANPNGESEVVSVSLSQSSKARVKNFDFDYAELAIKGRSSQGNILSKYPVRKITQKAVGESTIGGRDIWLDETVGRLNTEERGRYLGQFIGEDRVLILRNDGTYELTGFELTNHYDMGNVVSIEKLTPQTVISVVHYDGEKQNYFVKRFQVETLSTGQEYRFIGDSKNSKAVIATTWRNPLVEVTVLRGKKKQKETEQINLSEFIDVKGWKSLGNRLSLYDVKTVKLLEDLPEPETSEEGTADETSLEENTADITTTTQVKKEKTATKEDSSEEIEVGSAIEWDVKKGTSKKTKKGDTPQGSLF